jgi:ribose/xylose/arabinose/galactoside ABC-type transport system permease subunit
MTLSLSARALGQRLAPHALLLGMALIVVAFALAQPAFLKPENLVGILRQTALVGIMAVCMTFVIMTGGIDLSVGPVLALAGLVAVFALDAGWPLPAALAAALAAGLFIGLVNGGLVAFLELPAIIVTLAMLSVVRGSALMLGGPDLHGVRGHEGFSFIGTGSLFGLPFSVWLFAAVALTMVFAQHAMPLGLRVAAIGENERAARLSGHRTRVTKMVVYALCGLGAALAGIVQASQVHTASATYGEFGTELDVIAAVVLGGTSLSGGRGSVARTVVGVMFLGVLNNGMNILNVPIHLQLIAKGALIVAAMAWAEMRPEGR